MTVWAISPTDWGTVGISVPKSVLAFWFIGNLFLGCLMLKETLSIQDFEAVETVLYGPSKRATRPMYAQRKLISCPARRLRPW